MLDGGLQYLVVGPVGILQIREGTFRSLELGDCLSPGIGPVHGLYRLGPGDGYVGTESSVGIAVKDSRLGKPGNIVYRPVAVGVGEGILRGGFRTEHVAQQSDELGPGDGRVRTEGPIRIAVDDLLCRQEADGVGIPAASGHVGKALGICFLRVKVLREPGQDGGALAPGQVVLSPEGTVGIAHDVRQMVKVNGLQLRLRGGLGGIVAAGGGRWCGRRWRRGGRRWRWGGLVRLLRRELLLHGKGDRNGQMHRLPLPDPDLGGILPLGKSSFGPHSEGGSAVPHHQGIPGDGGEDKGTVLTQEGFDAHTGAALHIGHRYRHRLGLGVALGQGFKLHRRGVGLQPEGELLPQHREVLIRHVGGYVLQLMVGGEKDILGELRRQLQAGPAVHGDGVGPVGGGENVSHKNAALARSILPGNFSADGVLGREDPEILTVNILADGRKDPANRLKDHIRLL